MGAESGARGGGIWLDCVSFIEVVLFIKLAEEIPH
jgi:hypothetical protein